jgi:hypothetical protein
MALLCGAVLGCSCQPRNARVPLGRDVKVVVFENGTNAVDVVQPEHLLEAVMVRYEENRWAILYIGDQEAVKAVQAAAARGIGPRSYAIVKGSSHLHSFDYEIMMGFGKGGMILRDYCKDEKECMGVMKALTK